MPPELIALINKPVLLIAILFVGVLARMQAERFLSLQRRTAWKRRNPARWNEQRGGKSRTPHSTAKHNRSSSFRRNQIRLVFLDHLA
jgi:hypothetical protein